MPDKFYQNKLYPFQEEVLKAVESLGVDFYLTGGTALSRCYLEHRYSDDLDFFVNDHPNYKNQCNAVINIFKQSKWECEVVTTSESFVRVFLEDHSFPMKIDFVNDVPFHYGKIEGFHIFHRVDNWRNILSNKISALSRMEVKDVADILFIAQRYSFEWEDLIGEAKEKDLWVEPLEICRLIKDFPADSLMNIKWINPIDIEEVKDHVTVLHDDIFFGRENSLVTNS